MKKLLIDSNAVLQSDGRSISIRTDRSNLFLSISDWNTVSFLFRSSNASLGRLREILKLTQRLDQLIIIEIEGREVIHLFDGKISKWKFRPVFKLFRKWLGSR